MAGSYLELRFLIPQQNADIIIGPGGDNLSRLHMQYHAVVNISESETSERILTIGGFELLPICSMLNDILETLSAAALETYGYECESEICLLVDDSQVDPLTSREEMQLLVEDTGARIDVFPSCCPKSTERVLRVFGVPSYVTQCVFGLCTLLKYCPVQGVRQRYDASDADAASAADYGGYVANEPVAQVADQSVDMETQPENETRDLAAEPETCLKRFTIPANLTGVILGRNGSRLSHIRDESCANIVLNEGTVGTSDQLITISGSQEQVDNARLLLRMCIQACCKQID